jgi:hypothetical protein
MLSYPAWSSESAQLRFAAAGDFSPRPAAGHLWHDPGMRKPKYSVRIGNVYFLARIGLSLRWAAAGMAPDQLAPEIAHLLARLDQVEAQQAAAAPTAKPTPDSDAAI